MKIALAQFNPIVGDIAGNAKRHLEMILDAFSKRVDLVVFPELSIIGYPPHDLLDNSFVVDAVEVALKWLQKRLPEGIAVVVGAPIRNPDPKGKKLYNSAVFLKRNAPAQFVHKMLLPTYDIYEEYRYFEPSAQQSPIVFKGLKLGIHVCEDMWNLEKYATYHMYERNPVAELVSQGADILINLSASPYSHNRHALRTNLIQDLCAAHHVPFVLVSQVGANTDMIFDGDSRVHNAEGDIVALAPSFEESLTIWDSEQLMPLNVAPRNRIAALHRALVCGIAEYDRKSGIFHKALIGLSGGIDSAVTAALAVDALGAERVMGITMPSKYSSSGSVDDSVSLAKNLGITCHNIGISPAVDAFESMLSPLFEGTKAGVAEENIQARSRGLTLMAVSNKFGHLVLTTGNKSEYAMGYSTLYGDMSGGLAVLADVFKMDVYALARYMNEVAGCERIPVSTIEKAPSAELRPDQKDEDSLPPYPVLDEILRLYVEHRMDASDISLQTGYDIEFVTNLLRAVDRNEYKRKQAPPGLRVSDKAFGRGRRMPIVMKFDRQSIAEMMQDSLTHLTNA